MPKGGGGGGDGLNRTVGRPQVQPAHRLAKGPAEPISPLDPSPVKSGGPQHGALKARTCAHGACEGQEGGPKPALAMGAMSQCHSKDGDNSKSMQNAQKMTKPGA